ncbi:et translation product-related [Anaeramoeba flamelloides]|uniref:UNC93-like protein MFSD11 n=1 Tax=Anaeramoeba flamelloides TaxID=1746091 RepID=A0ABQ8Y6G8_9EUKA|nr:et translation product-related [Anaeramoeba flamelloides]
MVSILKIKPTSRINILVLSAGFFFFSCSYYATKSLITKLNKTLGFYSLALFYITFAFSNFFSPLVVRRFGTKACMIFGLLLYTGWISSSIKVIEWVFILMSFLMGIGAGICWTASGTYLIGCSFKNNIGTNSGIFFFFYLAGNLGGSLLSSLLLNIAKVSNEVFFLIFTSISVLGILILFLIVPVETKIPESKLSVRDNLMSIFRIYKHKRAILVIPMNIITGVSIMLVFGLLTLRIPKNSIPNVMMVYGIANALASMSIGKVIDWLGLKFVLFGCTIVEICAVIISFWAKSGNPLWLFGLIFGLFALSGAGLDTALYPLILHLFPKKIADVNAAFKFPRSLGTGIAFLLGSHMRGNISFIIVLILQFITLLCFIIIDQFIISFNFKKGYKKISDEKNATEKKIEDYMDENENENEDDNNIKDDNNNIQTTKKVFTDYSISSSESPFSSN